MHLISCHIFVMASILTSNWTKLIQSSIADWLNIETDGCEQSVSKTSCSVEAVIHPTLCWNHNFESACKRVISSTILPRLIKKTVSYTSSHFCSNTGYSNVMAAESCNWVRGFMRRPVSLWECKIDWSWELMIKWQVFLYTQTIPYKKH